MVSRDIEEWRWRHDRGRRVVPQDPFDWGRLRALLNARSSDTLSLPAYNQKFDARRYVPRQAVQQQVFDFLGDSGGPLKFIVAESGMGKTCFIRHLCLQIAARSDNDGWATLILRGLSAGIDRPDGLQTYLCGVIGSEFSIPDESRHDALVRLDRWLWAEQRKLLVIVDGVNEADDTRAVFGSIVDVVERLTSCACSEGRKTCVKLLVTSRPIAFYRFKSQDQAAERLQGVLRMAGEPRIGDPIGLELLDASELAEGLRRSGLSPTDVAGHFREVLSDPLLLGYFCDVIETGESVADLRTPLDLLRSVWALQARELQAQARGLALDPVARIVEICRAMLATTSDQASPEWSADDRQVMVTKVLVFEEIGDSATGRARSVRFRYDRLAHYLIARYAVLRDGRGQWRGSEAIVEVLVRATMHDGSDNRVMLPDVVRSALVTALVSLFEREFAERALAVPTVLRLLEPPPALFAGCKPDTRGAVMLELGEMAYDALVEAARWDAKAVVGFLLSWFHGHPGELDTATAGVLRRVAFNLLLSTSPAGHAGGAIDAESKARLCTLGAEALLTDLSGDACVLLYALYAAGAEQTALEVVRIAIQRLFAGDRRWKPT